jgi:MFS family permease
MGTIFISHILLRNYIDRIGYGKCLAVSQFLAVIFLGMIMYSKEFEVVLLAQVVMGVAAALWGPAESAWIANNVNPDERARAIASYSSLRTLASFPAPFIGGLIFDAYGFDIPILVNIVLAIVDIGLILWLIKDN